MYKPKWLKLTVTAKVRVRYSEGTSVSENKTLKRDGGVFIELEKLALLREG
jgi:hypothetical protein